MSFSGEDFYHQNEIYSSKAVYGVLTITEEEGLSLLLS
jgi:hypothetical protein